jgi:hypothetical protein
MRPMNDVLHPYLDSFVIVYLVGSKVDPLPLTTRPFVCFGRYSHKRPWCQACGNFRWHQITLSFQVKTLGMRLGPHGLVDGLCGLVLGFHTHKEELNILI